MNGQLTIAMLNRLMSAAGLLRRKAIAIACVQNYANFAIEELCGKFGLGQGSSSSSSTRVSNADNEG